MNTTILTMPDLPEEWRDQSATDWNGQWPAEWPEFTSWLDQQLMGLQLSQLVEELHVLRQVAASQSVKGSEPLNPAAQTPQQTLEQILNADIRERVRSQGTSALQQAEIQALFRSPETLLELQEDILIHGSKYWRTVPRSEEHERLAASGFEAIQARIRAAEQSPPSLDATTPKPHPETHSGPAKSRRSSLLAVAVLAMSVLVTLAILRPTSEPQLSGTGFGTAGLFENDVTSPGQYYQRMADANEQWLAMSRTDGAALLAALEAYSKDCEILIDSKHPALPENHERWLKAKCGEWKKKIDDVIVELKAGRMSYDDASAAAELVVGNLIRKLNSGPTEEELQAVG